MAQVLKPNCSLVGKSLISIILRVKAADADVEVVEFSRFKKDEPLESYCKTALIAEFEKLTGESVNDVSTLCGKNDSIENVRLLVHESIILANSLGARGQWLSIESTPQTDTPVAKEDNGIMDKMDNNSTIATDNGHACEDRNRNGKGGLNCKHNCDFLPDRSTSETPKVEFSEGEPSGFFGENNGENKTIEDQNDLILKDDLQADGRVHCEQSEQIGPQKTTTAIHTLTKSEINVANRTCNKFDKDVGNPATTMDKQVQHKFVEYNGQIVEDEVQQKLSAETKQSTKDHISQENEDIPLSDIKKFVKELELSVYYPNKLTFIDVIEIKAQVDTPTFHDMFMSFMKNLLMSNYNCRDTMLQGYLYRLNAASVATCNIQNELSEHDDLLDDLLETTDQFAFSINPLDLIIAAFVCSSPMLKQTLATKLFSCKLAIPFMFTTAVNNKFNLSIWPLRAITIPNAVDACEIGAVDCPCHIVSFIRLGRPFVSKSKLMNEILSDQYHDTFFNRDCFLGSTNRVISEGLVEAAWCLPSAKSAKSNVLDGVTMFLNMRGDGIIKMDQLQVLSKISSLNVVIVEMSVFVDQKSKELLLNLHSHVKSLLIAIDARQNSKENVINVLQEYIKDIGDHKNQTRFCILATQLETMSLSRIKTHMQKTICELLQKKDKTTISGRVSKSSLPVDEHEETYEIPKQAAIDIFKQCHTPEESFDLKEHIVPLQGTHWQSWSKMLKEANSSSAYKSTDDFDEIKMKMINARKKQLDICMKLGPVMKRFISAMTEDNYIIFGMWLKHFLDERSRTVLPKLMSKCHSDWQALQSARVKEEKSYFQQMELDKSKYNLTEASFGFEHLCREMGQIFEAIHTDSNENAHLNSYYGQLPHICAKLVLSGHAFEIMDGDAANVPLAWVKAVFQQLEQLIGTHNKMLALSVLGIQSSGKSTLLNTMFGLHLSDGAGRCTKGVFIQLVPVKDHKLPFDYILVIDTEGLRAPDLAHDKHNYDNELATFVIGLGGITIINIKGENTADIMQIAVHAFLRLKLAHQRLHLKQSCIFVHQYVPAVDAYDKMMHERQTLVDTLNKMTKEAAEEENIADINSFNQVIDFDSEKNVWYFSDLIRGDPPMAPVNPGYCNSVMEVKDTILFKLANVLHLTIPDTMSRIEDLWNGILNDDFVFSFRNTLELKAYNSMERKWQSLSWELEKCVLEFVRSDAKGSLINCEEEEEFQTTMLIIKSQLQKKVREKVEYLNNELDLFIKKISLKDVMVQFTQSKKNRLNDRAKELIMKTTADINNVKEEIRIMRMQSREKIKYEHSINGLARKSAIEMKGTKPNVVVLKQHFDTVWESWKNQLDLRIISKSRSIKDQIEFLLSGKFRCDAAFRNKENQQLPTQFNDRLERLEGSICSQRIFKKRYISIDNSLFGVLWQKESEEKCIEQSIDIINKIFRKIDLKMIEISILDLPVDVTDASDILNDIVCSIYQHNENYRSDGVYRFKFLPPYRAMVVNHVARYLTVFLTNLDEKYIKKHSTEAQLEEYKSTAWYLFHNLVESKTKEVIATGFFRKAIIKGVIDHVSELLAIDVAETILFRYVYSKSILMKAIMTKLAKNKCFNDLKAYIQDPVTFAKQWIMRLTEETIFNDKKGDSSEYAILATTRIQKIFRQLFKTLSETAIPTAPEKSSHSISIWINKFVSNVAASDILPLSSDNFTHVKDVQIEEISDFKNSVLDQKDEMQTEVLIHFKQITALTVAWKEHPASLIMDRLWGCPEICMFCKEPCQHTSKDHFEHGISHQCIQHRPVGIGGWRHRHTHQLGVAFCNNLIKSSEKYTMKHMTDPRRYRPYNNHSHEWDIPPSLEVSKYWMWVMYTFQEELKDMYHSPLEKIPEFWTRISLKEALNSIITPVDIA